MRLDVLIENVDTAAFGAVVWFDQVVPFRLWDNVADTARLQLSNDLALYIRTCMQTRVILVPSSCWQPTRCEVDYVVIDDNLVVPY